MSGPTGWKPTPARSTCSRHDGQRGHRRRDAHAASAPPPARGTDAGRRATPRCERTMRAGHCGHVPVPAIARRARGLPPNRLVSAEPARTRPSVRHDGPTGTSRSPCRRPPPARRTAPPTPRSSSIRATTFSMRHVPPIGSLTSTVIGVALWLRSDDLVPDLVGGRARSSGSPPGCARRPRRTRCRS